MSRLGTSRPFPDARARHPITLPNGDVHPNTVFLANVIDHPNVEFGDYTYYSDFETVDDHAARIAPYLYPGSPEKLRIGRFCQIAHGVRFITASANHPMRGLSAFPFRVFNPDTMTAYVDEVAGYGDTVIGNDVWLGYEATVLPGVTIGDGAIVGAKAVVSRDVPPYSIVAGDPARVVRTRFDDETIARLLAVRWWYWDIARIEAALPAIEAGDIDALERA
ncbi:CatB-related O-acetyltransferase [Tepidamorphus sp. 3E244]|uniref:CatB-related O-acetyltransferase n=1 Tax=Tepidamorphus sp. 3E244 TaxID=3385498 RepID=UPI0038FCC597